MFNRRLLVYPSGKSEPPLPPAAPAAPAANAANRGNCIVEG